MHLLLLLLLFLSLPLSFFHSITSNTHCYNFSLTSFSLLISSMSSFFYFTYFVFVFWIQIAFNIGFINGFCFIMLLLCLIKCGDVILFLKFFLNISFESGWSERKSINIYTNNYLWLYYFFFFCLTWNAFGFLPHPSPHLTRILLPFTVPGLKKASPTVVILCIAFVLPVSVVFFLRAGSPCSATAPLLVLSSLGKLRVVFSLRIVEVNSVLSSIAGIFNWSV